VDLPLQQLDDMIRLNVQAVSTLTHLFGKDMKERRRGRILMVSSVCGAVAGIPSVAIYSATKAFEKTLSLSMAKEMEPYGVGVTCLLPGAVSDTDFRARSNSEQALCWKIPFYPKTPPQIASMGVRAMLRGETEVTPGWMNRFFLKVMQPAMPQRMHNIIAGIMWSPLRLPFLRRQRENGKSSSSTSRTTAPSLPPKSPTQPPPTFWMQQTSEPPPRLLQLGDVADMEDDGQNETLHEPENTDDVSKSDLNADREVPEASPEEDTSRIPAGAPAQKLLDEYGMNTTFTEPSRASPTYDSAAGTQQQDAPAVNGTSAAASPSQSPILAPAAIRVATKL